MIDKSRPSRAAKSPLPEFLPVPRQTTRFDGWTPERQRGFIEALADTGSVKSAAHAVNMTPEGAYLLRRHPEAESFRASWEARSRSASSGSRTWRWSARSTGTRCRCTAQFTLSARPAGSRRGKLVGSRTVYNDRLLMFLLRNRAPARFAADSGSGGKSASGRSAGTRRTALGDPAEANRLSRLKTQWRKEWEAELAAKKAAEARSSEEIIAGINAKLDRLAAARRARMSPETRALWEAYQASEQADQTRDPLPLLPGVMWWEKRRGGGLVVVAFRRSNR